MSGSQIVVKFNRIPEIIRRSPAQIDQCIHAMALDGERDTKQSFGTSPSAPGDPPGVDTGALRNSIHVTKIRARHYQIGDGVEYGIHLEYGTRKMGARPFMRPMARRLAKRAPQFFRNFHKK